MNKQKIFLMTLMVMFITIMVMLTVFWQIGYPLMFGAVNLNLLIVPVLIGVFILPLKYGLVLGFLMGLSSFILSFVLGIPLFQNPLVSVLPRALFVIPTFYLYRFLRNITLKYPKNGKLISFLVVSFVATFALFYGSKALFDIQAWNFNLFQPFLLLMIVLITTFYFNYMDKIKEAYVYVPVSLILGTLTHSFLTIFMMILFGGGNFQTLFLLLTTNVLVEAILVVLVATPIVIVIKTIYPNIEKGMAL
jgi:uncharacterized membrane protein